MPKEIGEAVVILLQPYTKRELAVEDIDEMLNKKEFQPEPTREKLLTLSEAAAAMRISRTTLYRIIRDGDLAPCRIRGKVLIRMSDVDRVLRG
jgi:excisionase family DNA binding protein